MAEGSTLGAARSLPPMPAPCAGRTPRPRFVAFGAPVRSNSKPSPPRERHAHAEGPCLLHRMSQVHVHVHVRARRGAAPPQALYAGPQARQHRRGRHGG